MPHNSRQNELFVALESYLFDGIDHPLRIARPGASTNYFYYEIDLAGNVRGLRANGGASLGGYRYAAFGKTVEDTSLINQPLRWKARWFSPVAGGTYDVRARQWSPELGVFLEIDELNEHDGRTTLWLTIHPFSSSSAARNAAIASAAERSLARPREMVMVPGGPPEDLPV